VRSYKNQWVAAITLGHDWIAKDTDCAGPFSFGDGWILPFDSSRIFPVIFCRFPVIANRFPCYRVLGKSIKNRQKADKCCAIPCTGGSHKAFFSVFSLYFSLLC
jgi:hypothetical protein